MIAAMRSAASAALDGAAPEGATTDQLLDAQTAAASAAAQFGLIGGLPFGPIMGTDPLPTVSNADDRLADAAQRIELLVGYPHNDGAPFLAIDRRVERLKRLGRVGAAIERAAAAALVRRSSGPRQPR
jgi:para-nitrobenzyl esterase